MSLTRSVPSPVPRPSGYAELATELRALGLLRRRPGFYAALIAANFVALLLLGDGDGARARVVVADAARGRPGRGVGPDRLRRPRRGPPPDRAERRGGTLARAAARQPARSGFSYSWWVDKHNAHHAHPNDPDEDPDVYRRRRGLRRQAQAARRRGVGRLGGAPTRPGCSSRCCCWRRSPARVQRPCAAPSPVARDRWPEASLLAVHLVGLRRAPRPALSWLQALVFVVVHQARASASTWAAPSPPTTRACRCSAPETSWTTCAAPGAHRRATSAAAPWSTAVLGRPELPDRAPPVPEHAAAEPAARAPVVQRVLRAARGGRTSRSPWRRRTPTCCATCTPSAQACAAQRPRRRPTPRSRGGRAHPRRA